MMISKKRRHILQCVHLFINVGRRVPMSPLVDDNRSVLITKLTKSNKH